MFSQDEWLLEGEKICYCHRFLPCGKRSSYDWVLIQFRNETTVCTTYRCCCTFLPFRFTFLRRVVGRDGGLEVAPQETTQMMCVEFTTRHDTRQTDRCSSVSSTQQTTPRSSWSFCWTFALQFGEACILFTWCSGEEKMQHTYMLLNYYYFCY